MSDALVAVLASLTTLLTAAAGLFVKSRLGDVVASPSTREETAVAKMADLLDKLADFQAQRETRLFDLQDKAMETVGLMTMAVKEVTIAIQQHDSNTHKAVDVLDQGHGEILSCMERVVGQLEGIGGLISDLALEVIRGRGGLGEGRTRNATKD